MAGRSSRPVRLRIVWCMIDEISRRSWGEQVDKSFSGLRPEEFGVCSCW